MRPFISFTGVVAPIDRANVDTDAILPKQFMKSIRRTGFGDNLFDEWRYLDYGEPGADCAARARNQSFTLNQEPYQNASVLLARDNFGCGSSREHAPWALRDYGIRAIIAPSFGDIFFINVIKNGLLPIVLPAGHVDALFADVLAAPGVRLSIDLEGETVTIEGGKTLKFSFSPYWKSVLLEGWDEIDLTMKLQTQIDAYELRRRELEPWLFAAE